MDLTILYILAFALIVIVVAIFAWAFFTSDPKQAKKDAERKIRVLEHRYNSILDDELAGLLEPGYELVDKSWEAKEPERFSELIGDQREIIYRDPDGRLHQARIKTPIFRNVHLVEDRIIT